MTTTEKIKIGTMVEAREAYTNITVSGSFQGYRLEDIEDPLSVFGLVLEVRNEKTTLRRVDVDSIEIRESTEQKIKRDLMQFLSDIANGKNRSMPSATMCMDWMNWVDKQKVSGIIEEKWRLLRSSVDLTRNLVPEGYNTWPEEDEKVIDRLILRMDGHHFSYEVLQSMKRWLVELKKRMLWKPSSEHIVMLEKVGDGQMLNSLEQMAIADLCCELKKLV